MGRKRKNTEFPPRHQMKMPPCRICDAPGSGLHYGVNTCEACKGFFHRSFRNKSYYFCDFDNKCVIRFDQKKICAKCRYAKCLTCGMSKDAIKTGRYTLAKKARDTLEVRQLDMPLQRRDEFEDDEKVTEQIDLDDRFPQEVENVNSKGRKEKTCKKSKDLFEIQIPIQDGCSSFNNCETISSSSHRSGGCNLPSPDSSQNSSTDSSYINSPSAVDLSTGVILASKRSENPRSSITVHMADSSEACHPCSPTANHSSFCEGSPNESFYHMASELPPLVHQDIYSLQESPHATSMLSQETFSSVSSSSSPSFSRHSPPQFVTETAHQLFSKHLETDANRWPLAALASNLQISPECSLNINSSTYIPWSQIPIPVYPDQRYDFDESTRSSLETEITSSVHSESPSLLLPSSDIHAPETPPACDTDLSPMPENLSDEMWATLEEIYNDHDTVASGLLEAYTSHIHHLPGLEYEGIAKQQAKHYESCQLRTKLFGQLPLLLESEYEDFYQKTGLDIDGRSRFIFQKLECLVKSIRGVARFARAIPGFTLVTFQHMASLIKYARHDISLLYTQRLTNRDIPVTYVSSFGWMCDLDFDREISEKFVNPSIKIMMKMWDLELTLEETAIISAICVMSPDRANPTDSPLIRWIHSSLVDVLIKVLSRRLENPLPTFSRIVAVLTEFRSMEVEHGIFMTKNFGLSLSARYKCESESHPLLQDMLSELYLSSPSE